MAGEDVLRLEGFRAMLRDLDPASLAALLRELGHELYNREIVKWRVLTDISDELLDGAMRPARKRIADRIVRERERRGLLQPGSRGRLPGRKLLGLGP